MIAEIEDYFAKGCGRCARFDTADCATRHWAAGLAALRERGPDGDGRWDLKLVDVDGDGTADFAGPVS